MLKKKKFTLIVQQILKFCSGLPIFILILGFCMPVYSGATAGHYYHYFNKPNGAGIYKAKLINGKLYGEITTPNELMPGLYRIDIPYRTESIGNAQFAAYIISKQEPQKMLPSWQNFSSSKQWSTFSIFINLKTKIVPTVIINQGHLDRGKIKNFEIKEPKIVKLNIKSGENYFDNNGYFQGSNKNFPRLWVKYSGMNNPQNGLSSKWGFEKSDKVMRLVGDQNSVSEIMSVKFPSTLGAKMKFSIWARSVNDSATITLRSIWGAKKFKLSKKWKEYAINGLLGEKLVAKYPYLACRIGVQAQEQVLIGRVKLTDTNGNFKKNSFTANKKLSPNLICNPGFELGSWGWNQHIFVLATRSSKKMLTEKTEIISGGASGGMALKCNTATRLISFCFPVKYKGKYTISAFMKNASPEHKAKGKMHIVDNNFKMYSQTFKLTDQWKRYSFSVDWNYRSKRNVAYFWFTPISSSVLIAKVQVEQGNLSNYRAQSVQLGLTVPAKQKYNIFNDSSKDATMILKAICNSQVKGDIKLTLKISDAWGEKVLSKNFNVKSAPSIELPIKINENGRRGVFHAEIKAFDSQNKIIGYGESRYAVCRNLSELNLPDNPVAGHYCLFDIMPQTIKMIKPLISNYIPTNGFNRCFYALSTKQTNITSLIKSYRALFTDWNRSKTIKKVLALNPSAEQKRYPWIKKLRNEASLSPEILKKYLEYIKKRVTLFHGVVDGWELFNEPYLWRNKDGQATMSPEKTAMIYKAAYPIIKKIDPSILVLGPCADLGDFQWTERFLSSGGVGNFDILSFHGYSDDADLFGTYNKIERLRGLLAKYKMSSLPIWNTEQYYAARIPYLYGQESEFYRSYYRDAEIDAAAAWVSNFIHHGAAGAKAAMFTPNLTLFNGIGKELFLYDAFAAINTVSEFLGTAGNGKPLDIGSAFKCFVFPKAQNGTLVTVNTINVDESGTMLLPHNIQAFDMMGNRINKHSVPIRHEAVYLRFPKGTSEVQVKNILQQTPIIGVGNPFSFSLTMKNRNQLALIVNNRQNQDCSGIVTITKAPSGWSFENYTQRFDKLLSSQSTELLFKTTNAYIKSMEKYNFKFSLKSKRSKDSFNISICPILVSFMGGITGGGNIDAWKHADWKYLAQNNTSTEFNGLSWRGTKDLNAEFAYGWNDKGLGLAVIVSDDLSSFPSNVTKAYEYDSIQVYFDIQNDATTAKANMRDDIAYTICLRRGGDPIAYLEKASAGRYIGEANVTTGIDGEVKVSCHKLPDGRMFYDIFFPRQTLPGLKFTPGTAIGTSFLINDNDGKGRKTGLTLSPKGKEPYNAPVEYIDLILIK